MTAFIDTLSCSSDRLANSKQGLPDCPKPAGASFHPGECRVWDGAAGPEKSGNAQSALAD